MVVFVYFVHIPWLNTCTYQFHILWGKLTRQYISNRYKENTCILNANIAFMHGLRTFYAMYNVFLGTPKIQSGILGFNFPLVLSPERKLLKVQAPKKTYMFRSSLSKLYHDTRVQYHIHKLDENLLRRYWIYLDLINWFY